MNWQPIETAPKDGTACDLLAKAWLSHNDKFAWRRFTDYRWSKSRYRKPDKNGEYPMTNVDLSLPAGWERESGFVSGEPLPEGWYVTHWMPIPTE